MTVQITREFLMLKRGHHFEWINDALYISILDNEMSMYFIRKALGGYKVPKTPPENTDGYEYMVKWTMRSNEAYRKAIRTTIQNINQEVADDYSVRGVTLDDINQVINACRAVAFVRSES